MLVRLAAALFSVVLVCGCTDNPSPLRLTATVTPNPLAAPVTAGDDVFYDVELRNTGRATILIERGSVMLLDASGLRVGESRPVFSRSAGCSVCSGDVTIPAGRSERWSRNRAHFVGGGAPVRLVYTIFYSDDLGPGSTTVEVPIR